MNGLKRARGKETEEALTWSLKEIAENAVTFHNAYGDRWHIDDADAWEEMHEYLRVPD